MAKELSNLTIKLDLESAGCVDGLANINRSFKTLESEMRVITATFGKTGMSLDGLKAKESVLTRQLELQKTKVSELRNKYLESAEATGQNSKKTASYARQLNQAIAQEERIKSELNRTSEAISKQTNKWDKLRTKMATTGAKMQTLGKTIEGIGAKFKIMSAGLAVALGIGMKSTLNFGDNMAKVSSIADTSQVSISNLKNGVMDMSDKTGVSASQLANSLYETMSAGIDTADALDVLGVATKASKAGFCDSETAINGITNVLNAYNLKSKDSIKISDEMLIAQNLGKCTLNDLAQSMGNVTPIASALNVSTEELFASIAVLTKNGIQTSEAITGLKAAYSNVLKPSDQAAKLAEKLGLNFNAAHLKSVGWAKFLDEVKEKTGGDAEKMATLFGSVEALNTVTVLAGKGSKDFAQALDAMGHSAGTTENAYNKMLTPAERFRIALNKLKNDGIRLGTTLLPVFEKITSGIGKVADKVGKMSEGQKKFLASAVAIGAVLAPVTIGVGKFVHAIGTIHKGLSKCTGGFKKLEKGARIAKKAFRIIKVGVLAAKAALLGLSAPVLITVAVITALAAAAFIVYKNWDKIKKATQKLGVAMKQTWTKIKTNTMQAWDNIKTATVNKVVGMVTGIKAKWAGLKAYFTNVWNIIKTIFLGALLLIIDLCTGNFTKLKSDATQIFNKLKEYFSNIWNAIKTVFSGALEIISNLVSVVWNGICDVTNSIWNSIISFLSSVWNNIKSTAINGWNAMKTGIINIIHNTKSSIVNLWNSIVNWFSTLPSRLMAKGRAMMNGLKNGCASMYGSIKSSISNGINNALSFLSSIPSKMWNYGCNIIQGLINGIKSKISAIGSAISGVASTISNGIRGALGIHSPSRVMMELGGYTSEGLALGIKEKADMVKKATRDIAGIVESSTSQMSANVNVNYASNSVSNNNGYYGGTNVIEKQPIYLQLDGRTIASVVSTRMAMNSRGRR